MNLDIQNLQLDNHGERLIPGYSHGLQEYIRHRSTYQLFRKIIEKDILKSSLGSNEKVKILDLGCGSGHGSFMLAQIPNTLIFAIDISEAAINFAKNDYAKENIIYKQANADDGLKEDMDFDYVVSRHALEHMQNPAEIISKLKFKKRLLLSVPYKEPEGNIFHLHNNIDETFFSSLPNMEYIYENLQGLNDVKAFQNETTNSFTGISSKQGISKVVDILEFPQQPYQPDGLEKMLFPLQEEMQRLQTQHENLHKQYQDLETQHQELQAEHQQLLMVWPIRIARLIKRFFSIAA